MPHHTLIPFESGFGAQRPETAGGPAALEACGLSDKLRDMSIAADWASKPGYAGLPDYIPPLGTRARRDLVLAAVTQHRDRVAQALNKGYNPVTLGGDHAMAMGTMSGIANAKRAHGELGVLWIDAHMDAHTHETSPSKAIHGMPLAHLLGYGDDSFVGLGTQSPIIRPEHLAIVGAQSWEPEEYDLLKSLGVRIYFIEDIHDRGFETVLAEACARINAGTYATALSLDIDVLDPEEVAGFGSPEPGGLGVATFYDGLRWLAANQDFDAVELAEYNPERDDTDHSTAQVVEQALTIMLSGSAE